MIKQNTYWKSCELCGSYIHGVIGQRSDCLSNECASYSVWFEEPRAVSNSELLLYVKAQGWLGNPAELERDFGLTADYFDLKPLHMPGYASREVSRAYRHFQTKPSARIGTRQSTKGPAPVHRVATPDGDYLSIMAASKAHGVSYQTGYTRATRGFLGWSLKSVEEERRPAPPTAPGVSRGMQT